MRILVTGGSGFIGSHVVRALAARGHHVIVCARKPGAVRWPAGVTAIECDYVADHTTATWTARLAGIDAVINTVGIIRETGPQTFDALHRRTPAALFRACEAMGVRRVVQISALGADQAAQSRYHLTKRAADDLLASSSLQWVILRPSLVYGAGGGSNTLFHALAALPLVPLVGDGRQPIRPVHVDDLVRAVVAGVEDDAAVGKRVDVVGAEELGFADYLQHLRTWLGFGRLRTLHVPHALALRGARLAGFLGDAPVTADTVAMLQRGNTASTETFERCFGFRPAGVTQWLASRPAWQADRWHARLFPLRPLLRLCIGFVWVWAAITSAWLYPHAASLELLAAVGLTGVSAELALYSAAALDLGLGLATWFGWRLREAAALQLIVTAVYTLILTLFLPAFWLHPFGPVAKNIPLIAATLMLIVLEDRKS